MKEHSLGENISERLVSISVDGHVLNWSISKGFESSQLMNLKRTSGKKQVVKKSKAKTNQIRGGGKLSKQSSKTMTKMGLSYISQYAPGMGLDFWPKDPNMCVPKSISFIINFGFIYFLCILLIIFLFFRKGEGEGGRVSSVKV